MHRLRNRTDLELALKPRTDVRPAPGECALRVELLEGERVLAQGDVDLPLAALCAGMARIAGENASKNGDWESHGDALWCALRPIIGKRLEVYHDEARALRLFLRCEGSPELWGPLWEALGGASSLVTAGRWEIVRRGVDGPALGRRDGKSLRVLLLVGSLEDLARGEDSAYAALRALRRLASEQRLELDLAASQREVGGFFVGDQRRTTPDKRFLLGQRRHVADVLRRGYHVVHLIGHSAPPAEPQGSAGRRVAPSLDPLGAAGLWFDFPHGPDSIAAVDLASALAVHPPVLLVVQACAGRAQLALPLLASADHVITATSFVHPDLCGDWAETFYAKLAVDAKDVDSGRVGYALRAARARLFEHERWDDEAWTFAHWARTDDDVVFDPKGDAVARYCGAIASEQTSLHLRFGARLVRRLDEVHEPLFVVRSPERDRAARTSPPDEPPTEGAPVSPLPFPALLALDGNGKPARWILRGGPGSGKTTTLRHHAGDLAHDTQREHVPIYLRLPEWMKARAGKSHAADAFLRWVAKRSAASEPAGVAEALAGAPRLLLFDGWDELAKDAREEAVRAIGALERAWSTTPMVVAARTTSQVDLGGWREAAIQGLEPEAQENLLRKWFESAKDPRAAERAAEWRERIARGTPTLRELGTNPLMLTILADLILAGRPVEDRARHVLLGDVVTCFLEGVYAAGAERPMPRQLPDEARAWLRELAWRMSVSSTRTGTTADVRTWVGAHEHTESLLPRRSATRPRRGAHMPELRTMQLVLERIAEDSGLLEPQDERRETWEWSHRLLQEALAAEHWWHVLLAEGTLDEPERAVLEELDRRLGAAASADALDYWTEPVALVAERLPGGSRLLEPLLRDERRRELGLRVLESLERVEADVVRALVASDVLPGWKPGNWRAAQPRALAYELFSERADDPRRMIAVLAERGRERRAPLAELGAIVECLVRLGQGASREPVPGRDDDRVAARLGREQAREATRAAIDELLERRLPKLARNDVGKHFRWIPRVGDEEEPKRSDEPLWCRAPREPGAELAFRMGDDGVDVTFSHPLWIAATPVTCAQYARFDTTRPSPLAPNEPVVDVSWFEAMLFCRWLDHQRRRPELRNAWSRVLASDVPADFEFRLPTEAQWELCCRAGTPWELDYWSGNGADALARVGWYAENTRQRVHPVAERDDTANPWGLYDVHGNVWEWCWDRWGERLSGGRDPVGPASGRFRVQRGGCYGNDAAWCRSAARVWGLPDFVGVVVVGSGFRVALSAPPSGHR